MKMGHTILNLHTDTAKFRKAMLKAHSAAVRHQQLVMRVNAIVDIILKNRPHDENPYRSLYYKSTVWNHIKDNFYRTFP